MVEVEEVVVDEVVVVVVVVGRVVVEVVVSLVVVEEVEEVVVVVVVVDVVVVVVDVVVAGTCLSPNLTSTKSSEDITTVRELLVVACHPLGTTSDTVYVPRGMQNSNISPYWSVTRL